MLQEGRKELMNEGKKGAGKDKETDQRVEVRMGSKRNETSNRKLASKTSSL